MLYELYGIDDFGLPPQIEFEASIVIQVDTFEGDQEDKEFYQDMYGQDYEYYYDDLLGDEGDDGDGGE